MARPKIAIDEKVLKGLAQLHLPDKTIAAQLGVSVDTLNRRYANLIEEAKSGTKAKLANIIWAIAIEEKAEWALKLLGQNILGYGKKVVEVEHKGQINNNGSQPENVTESKVRDILAKIESEV